MDPPLGTEDTGPTKADGFFSNVESRVPLRRATSAISSAGSGMYAEERIPANQEIFRIKQPLMIVIYGTHRAEHISNSVRAIMRLLHLRASGQLTEGQWRSLRSLKSHRDEFKAAQGSIWQGIEADCQLIRDGTGTDMDEDVLQNLICMFFVNSMGLAVPEQETIGSCLDPSAALMNHSCEPNAGYFFEGPELRVRSTRTIRAEEEITISYIDPTVGFDFRQEQLRTTYFFDCKCNKCKKGPAGPGELIVEDPELGRRFRETQNRLIALLGSGASSCAVLEMVADRLCREGYPGRPWTCDVHPGPTLWVVLATGYQGTNLAKSLRYWVKTCFKVDPLIRPSRYDHRRVENFMKFRAVQESVTRLLSVEDPSVQELQPLDYPLGVSQYLHAKRFTQDATRAFGKDSTIAHVARIGERAVDNIFVRSGINPRGPAWFLASAEGLASLEREEAWLLEWAESFDSVSESV